MGIEDYMAMVIGLWVVNLLLLSLIWANLDLLSEEIARLRKKNEV